MTKSQFIASCCKLFPINSSSQYGSPDPQRQEGDLTLSLCLASPIVTAGDQQGGSNCHGAQRGGRLQAQIPVFTESSSYVPPLQRVTATDNLTFAKFGHLYPMTAVTQQQTNHTPAWKEKWKGYTQYDLNTSGSCADNLQLSNQEFHKLFKRQRVYFSNPSERTNSILIQHRAWGRSTRVQKRFLKT